MNYLSVCSGIEAATVGWHSLGWQPVAFSEIEKFPCSALAYHYPDVPNWGDMTKFKEWPDANVNVLVGGTPCQSFSVAGLRKGLADPRGNLMLTYLAIAAKYSPEWLVWENVPGVLSSNGGRDFASLLRGMGQLGYGFAYRILDAQYFGVPQRRRRVFVVGCIGGWQRAAAVLFERHSLQRHTAPRRKAREGVASTVTTRTGVSRNNHEECVSWPAEISGTLNASFGKKMGLENQHINADCPMFVPTKAFYESSLAQYREDDIAGTTKASGGVAGGGSETFIAQPIALQDVRAVEKMQNGRGWNDDGTAYTVDTYATQGVAQPISFSGQMSNPQTDVDMTQTLGAKNPMAVATHDVAGTMLSRNTSGGFSNSIDYAAAGYMALQAMAVRRLTPVECERLQGFPDNYTDIQPKGKATPDGPRYKALGNSMAVPVMAWIGKRIQQVEEITCTTKQKYHSA